MDDANGGNLLISLCHFRVPEWRRPAVCLLLGAAVGLPAAAPCEARVFARWHAAAHSGRVLSEAGGRLVYEAAVTINGGSGELSVFNFERSPEPLVDELEKAFGAPFRRTGGDGAMARIAAEGHMVSLIAVSLGAPGRTLVFRLDQPDSEALRSRSAPSFPPLDGVPPYPGGTVETVMFNGDTQMTLVTANSAAAPETVRAFYNAALTGGGWKPAFPGDTAGGAVGFYLRGTHLCCVSAGRAEGSTRTRITVLHKKLGVK